MVGLAASQLDTLVSKPLHIQGVILRAPQLPGACVCSWAIFWSHFRYYLFLVLHVFGLYFRLVFAITFACFGRHFQVVFSCFLAIFLACFCYYLCMFLGDILNFFDIIFARFWAIFSTCFCYHIFLCMFLGYIFNLFCRCCHAFVPFFQLALSANIRLFSSNGWLLLRSEVPRLQ